MYSSNPSNTYFTSSPPQYAQTFSSQPFRTILPQQQNSPPISMQSFSMPLNSSPISKPLPQTFTQPTLQYQPQQPSFQQPYQMPSIQQVSQPVGIQTLQPIQQQTFYQSPPQQQLQQVQEFQPPPPNQIVKPPIILPQASQPLEKPIVILNCDMQQKYQQNKQLPQIIDNTESGLLQSLSLKAERLVRMENILNSQISSKISSSNAKEVLINQIKDQRQKLEDIVRLQAIRIDELKSACQRGSADLDKTIEIADETEKELETLKYLLEEKEKVVDQWKARGTDVERQQSDLSLLQAQLNQLQTQNQVLRNNIKLDPSYNYLII